MDFSPPLSFAIFRSLSAEDKVLISTERVGAKVQTIKKIRAIHHQVARLCAAGMEEAEVALVTGMSIDRIYCLKLDSSFKELVEFYTGREKVQDPSVTTRLSLLGLDAAAELHERIIDNPEEVSTKTLMEVAAMALDRSGHNPINKNVVLTKEDLDALKSAAKTGEIVQRSAGAGVSRVLPETPLGRQEISSGSEGTGARL